MTVYQYMEYYLGIECCAECHFFKNWKCIGDHDQGDRGCLALHKVDPADIPREEISKEKLYWEIKEKIRLAKETARQRQEKKDR